ncbi:LysR substrate-binding domain-containing protein [Phreatobacter stygius]|uniref:LysR family transcriptional regulator n=1 Tax=Phreatobacter stygius TaxID=1940610 RepID=A0A4D7B6E7_9HYPH|nr:LysR substrate-binding domain-containing protein [Phreatobacter stygius]QCI68571.1 LysR family transcriptional regulator [Phreatobacter stygius]
MRYDLTDLKLFRAIAEAASLSAGAAQIYLSAGSASYRLKNLERTVGTALFLRTPRGMELTAAGEHLLKHVARVFSDLECMHGEMSGFAKGMRGNIRLFANSSSLNGFLPRDLAGFLVANGQVNIELEEHNSDDIVLAVSDGIADIGVMASDISSGSLQVYPYAEDSLVLTVAPGHPLAESGAIRLDQALDHDFVCMHRASSNFQFLAATAGKLGKHLKVRIHAQNFATVLQLVAANVGVALVPRSVLGNAFTDRTCVAVPLLDAWAERRLKIVTRDINDASAFMKGLVGHLLKQATTDRASTLARAFVGEGGRGAAG